MWLCFICWVIIRAGRMMFRSHKRYYYRNASTSEAQWTYPVADIAGGAEEMELCTTPPPPEHEEAPIIGESHMFFTFYLQEKKVIKTYLKILLKLIKKVTKSSVEFMRIIKL